MHLCWSPAPPGTHYGPVCNLELVMIDTFFAVQLIYCRVIEDLDQACFESLSGREVGIVPETPEHGIPAGQNILLLIAWLGVV